MSAASAVFLLTDEPVDSAAWDSLLESAGSASRFIYFYQVKLRNPGQEPEHQGIVTLILRVRVAIPRTKRRQGPVCPEDSFCPIPPSHIFGQLLKSLSRGNR